MKQSGDQRQATVIAVANQKGGVGKTTTAVNLAGELARRGRRVLLIDCDPQGNATTSLGVDKRELTITTYEALIATNETVDAIRATGRSGFDLVPATEHLAGAMIELAGMEQREWRMRQLIEQVKTTLG